MVVGPSAKKGNVQANSGPDRPENHHELRESRRDRAAGAIVSLVIDTFSKNATGVSALQHAYVFALMATFSPTECLIAAVSYLPRAVPDGHRTRTSVFFGILGRRAVV